MKNVRLERLLLEQKKVREKIAALQERDKELEKLIRDAENISIVGLVRAEGYTLESLSALIDKLRDNPFPDNSAAAESSTEDSQADLPGVAGEEEPTL